MPRNEQELKKELEKHGMLLVAIGLIIIALTGYASIIGYLSLAEMAIIILLGFLLLSIRAVLMLLATIAEIQIRG